MTLQQEIKDDYRVVSGWLLYYDERRRSYERKREEILHSSTSKLLAAPPGEGISDSTGKRGAKLGDLKNISDWLALIEEVETSLSPKMRLFLRLRREAVYAKTNLRGRPGWVAYTQEHYAREMAKLNRKRPSDYWVEDRTLFAWWDKIVTYTAIKASKRGLLE